MYINATGAGGDARFGRTSSGYGAALDGLRGFDSLTATLRARQDVIQRSAARAASSYPVPSCGRVVGSGAALAGAVSAYAGSESGRANIEKLAGAAGSFLGRLFGAGGPEQLPLPLDV